MKLNTKIRYGLRTVMELAIQYDNESGVFQKDIAEKQNISLKYLDQIISSLKASNIIMNVQGKKSGYKLTKSPAEFSVYDIYKTFESDLCILECLEEKSNCQKRNCCASRDFWNDFNQHMITYLKGTSIQELAFKQSKYTNSVENLYFI